MAKETKRLSLSTLAPAHGARSRKVRVGRGESSGLGKTSGRGGKGQTARKSGKFVPVSKAVRCLCTDAFSKFGFRSQLKVFGVNKFHAVNLGLLEKHFKAGDIVGPEELRALGFGRTNRNQGGYKLLGTGTLNKKLTVKIHAISASARASVEAAGGVVEMIAPVAAQEPEAKAKKSKKST